MALVHLSGYVDVFLLYHLCPCIMEKTPDKLALITRYFSEFTDPQLTQLAALDELYRDWNSKINVISRKDIDSLYEKHVLHSLSIAAVFEFEPGTSVIDIGTGGGFPGIPLAIFFPEVKFHLVDSIAKKIKVVDAVVESIGLKNVSTQHTRGEEIKNRRYDFVVSRAVAPLKDLWKWSKPLLSQESGVKNQKPAYRTGRSEVGSQISRLTTTPGLICLKGGDLAIEIQESNTRPRIMEISGIFPEEYFRNKFILYIPVK